MPDLETTGFNVPYLPTRAGLEQFYPELFQMWQQGVTDPLDPSQQVAPLTPYQQQGIGQLAGYGAPGGAGAGIEQFLTGQMGAGLNMDEVMGYADNPWMDDAITAALRDPFRQLTEQQLPGIDLQSAFSGGLDSSTNQLASAVAERGYADRASDVGAQMRSQAYQDALRTTAGTRGQDLNFANLGQQIGLGNIDALLYGGGMEQQQNQALANALQGNWQYGVDQPWQMAQNFAGITGPGASAFADVVGTGQPGILDVLLGGAVGGGASGLFDYFQDLI